MGFVEPDRWLGRQPGPRPDPVAALDAAKILQRAREHGLLGTDNEADALVALDLLLERQPARRIARALGVAENTVSQWRRRERRPSPEMSARLVGALCEKGP